MRFFSLKSFHKGRAGFTVIELMAAVSITAVISLGAAVATTQVMNQTSRNTDYTAASRYASNAVYWISRDVLMAQSIQGCDDFPAAAALSLSWTGWDNTAYTATYTVTGGVLERTWSDGVDTSVTMIAPYINPAEDMTFCTSVNGTVTLTVTSSVGEGGSVIDVTKTRVITNRPGL